MIILVSFPLRPASWSQSGELALKENKKVRIRVAVLQLTSSSHRQSGFWTKVVKLPRYWGVGRNKEQSLFQSPGAGSPTTETPRENRKRTNYAWGWHVLTNISTPQRLYEIPALHEFAKWDCKAKVWRADIFSTNNRIAIFHGRRWTKEYYLELLECLHSDSSSRSF